MSRRSSTQCASRATRRRPSSSSNDVACCSVRDVRSHRHDGAGAACRTTERASSSRRAFAEVSSAPGCRSGSRPRRRSRAPMRSRRRAALPRLHVDAAQRARTDADREPREPPRLTDQWPDGYFRHGTMMHLSHLFEDLEDWYSSDSSSGVWATFRPGSDVADGTRTVPEDASVATERSGCRLDAVNCRLVGHSASLQPVSRLAAASSTTTARATRRGRRSFSGPISTRSRIRSAGDRRPRTRPHARQAGRRAAFRPFTATATSFERVRRAMDGHYAGRQVHGPPAAREEQGLNTVLRTTHRQNFLVPPRAHRSFPLAELL